MSCFYNRLPMRVAVVALAIQSFPTQLMKFFCCPPMEATDSVISAKDERGTRIWTLDEVENDLTQILALRPQLLSL